MKMREFLKSAGTDLPYTSRMLQARELDGYVVNREGMIFNRYGRRLTAHLRFRDGRIDRKCIYPNIDGVRKEVAEQRFVYAAWYPDKFHYTDESYVIVSKEGSGRFETRPEYLLMMTREMYHKEYQPTILSNIGKENYQLIYDTWKEVEGKVTLVAFLEHFEISRDLFDKIKEDREESA